MHLLERDHLDLSTVDPDCTTRDVHSNHGQIANGVDPGVRSVFAFSSLTDPALKMSLKQNQWQQDSGMRDVGKMRRSQKCPSQAVLTAAPSEKCLIRDLAEQHHIALNSIWDQQWAEVSLKRHRRLKFYARNRRRSAIDKFKTTNIVCLTVINSLKD